VAGDLVVLEASGNSFESCERLKRCGVCAVVLESQRAGQIRKTYCANDRSDAVKLARIYLSGLAHSVWQPDAVTRERREVLHAYRKAVTIVNAREELTHFRSYRIDPPPHEQNEGLFCLGAQTSFG
jgi:hypothetical protein